MAFSKSFPRTDDKSPYTKWEEVFLSDDEESLEESKAREENNKLMKECLGDAKEVIKDMKDYQSDLISVAIALFEKRASHVVYFKERKAKDKFDSK